MNIRTINIDKFPVIIFTDSHTNLSNIKKLKKLYPDNQFVCLGDITFLFSKPGEKFNQNSIQYFIDNQIPCLAGNHESHILSCAESDNRNSLIQFKVIPTFYEENSLFDIYGLNDVQLNYLKNLPIGFKLVLPNDSNYYCFHNEPNNLWNFPDNITQEYFREKYIFNSLTLGVLQGHLHINHVDNFSPKRFVIGRLCNSNHHTGKNNGRNYAIITENGVEFKKLV